jgi:phenylpropionate dioxygenase-like ring-hydroxylating dioxygenase large terminal subunit
MSMLDFWHPVLRSRDVPRKQAVGVKLAGRSLAVFRSDSGALGALEDLCPHRRMRLSVGKVQGGKLRCAYHGWTFDCAGRGESPGTPKLQACVTSYECREAHGAVWIKARGTDRPLPELSFGEFVPVGVVIQRAPAPLELVIDNFGEIEHTVAMHPFGIDPARASEAEVKLDSTDTTITVSATGPAKPPPFFSRRLLLFRRSFLFHSDYQITFQPPCSAVVHRWTDPVTGREAMIKYRLYHFFVPEDPQSTLLATFGAVRSHWPVGPGGGVRPFRWYMRYMIRLTVDEDIWLLRNLADRNTEIQGMKLGRFDRIMGLTRGLLARQYYGKLSPRCP